MGQFLRCKACHNAKSGTSLYKCRDCNYRFCDDLNCGPYESHTFSASGHRCPNCTSFSASNYGEIDDDDDEYHFDESDYLYTEPSYTGTSINKPDTKRSLFDALLVVLAIWLGPLFCFQIAVNYFGFTEQPAIAAQLIPVLNWGILALLHVVSLLAAFAGSDGLIPLLLGDAVTITILFLPIALLTNRSK